MQTSAQPLTMPSRRYYIQKQYQSKMILKFCLLAILGGALLCVSYYTAMDRDISVGYIQALEGMRYIKAAMVRNFIYSEAAIILLLGLAVVVVTLLMSHRIAGPLWRVEQTAKAVGEGDLTCEIHLRKNDELRTLADQMNKMTKLLRKKAGYIGTVHKLLDIELARYKEKSDMGELSQEDSLAHVREILDMSKSLRAALEEIKSK
jgi:methyl-accepting chemotaxis protein